MQTNAHTGTTIDEVAAGMRIDENQDITTAKRTPMG